MEIIKLLHNMKINVVQLTITDKITVIKIKCIKNLLLDYVLPKGL